MVYPCLNREEVEKTSKHYIKQGAFSVDSGYGKN